MTFYMSSNANKSWVLKKRAVGYRHIDAGQILVDDAASPEI
jgi:hypothetical protein